MSESEVFVFIVSIVLGVVGIAVNSTAAMPNLYFRNNPAPGIVRAGVLLSLAWIGLVLWRWADPSVAGIYVVFYLVMGYAAVKMFGQTAAGIYGLRTRIDAAERRNVPAAIVIAAFTLATGLIFGGSLWGEADPVGDGEGGWWIPSRSSCWAGSRWWLAFALFELREPGSFARRLRRDRSVADARAAATFLLGAAVVLTDAVAGDFWGWWHGLLSFGVLAVMLLAHEVLAPRGGVEETARRGSVLDGRDDAKRIVESLAYLAIAGVVWLLNRAIDAAWGAG
jgi:hypothetical protein